MLVVEVVVMRGEKIVEKVLNVVGKEVRRMPVVEVAS